MDYYKLLDFKIEPFSNSPDPRLFYHSRQHLEVLQNLEISIRLKRGLNVVIGDIGTGKTTISRQLIQKISNDAAIDYHLILDPGFNSIHGFLTHILQLLKKEPLEGNLDENSLKEQIKAHLFSQGVDGNINTILVIDEGQKLSLESIEVLRELLNFETNDQKLLQIVIFAQNEFEHALNKVKNFQDRINFRYNLTDLNFKESKGLIQYRLNQSFVQGKQQPLFSLAALMAIYLATKGSPRKMVTLCHQVILSLIIKNKKKAGICMVRTCVKKATPPKKANGFPGLPAGMFVAGLFVAGILMAGMLLSGTILPEKYQPGQDTGHSQVQPMELQTNSKGMQAFNGQSPTVPEAPTPPSVPAPSDSILPDIYGSILVPENTTVSHMIKLVYGTFHPKLLSQVLQYNKTIADPDRLTAGIPFYFPVLGRETRYDDQTIFLVILQTLDFKQAFARAASVRHKGLAVRILSFQSQDKGYLFNLVIDRPFKNQEMALVFLQKIQPEIMAVPKNVVSLRTIDSSDKG